MTVQKLLDIISQGEGVTIEFKECKNEISSDAYPTVCSFSNRYGGHLFMGIDDNGNIKGVNPKCVKDISPVCSTIRRSSHRRCSCLPRNL